MASPAASMPSVDSRFAEAFPNSARLYVEGGRVRVPVREIALSGSEAPLQVYDTSGPHETDARAGLAPLRRDWIAGRGDVAEVVPARRAHGSEQIRRLCTVRSCAAGAP